MGLYESNFNNKIPTYLVKKGHHKSAYKVLNFYSLKLYICFFQLPNSPLKCDHILPFTRITGIQTLTLVRKNKSQKM